MGQEIDFTQVLSLSDSDDPMQTCKASAAGLSSELTIKAVEVIQHEENNTRDLGVDFELLSVLGKGGQGEVWEATQLLLGRKVAIKLAHANPQAQDGFTKEAFTAAQLDHPNIVPIHDMGHLVINGKKMPALSMKKVSGVSWRDLIDQDRKELEPSFFLAKHLPIFIDMLNAVAFAHAHHFIHRDLKPAQVMVGGFGEVYLLDWGLAVYLEDLAKESGETPSINPNRLFTLESAANPAGSPAYMAPEQVILDTSRLGKHTDIYLLGATLFELIEGRPPHEGKTFKEVMPRIIKNECLPLPQNTHPGLRKIVEACLSTDPLQRPRDVCEILQAVKDYLTGAGKKEESRRITDRLSTLVGDAPMNYDQLSDAMQALGQAELNWSENPQLYTCKSKVLSAYVECALSQGDYIIAQLQADRIPDPVVREEYKQRVAETRKQVAASLPIPPLLTVPRLAMAALFSVVIIVALGTITRIAERQILTELKNQVMAIANVAASDIRTEDLSAVRTESDLYTGEFQRILNQLNTFRRANEEIRYLQTCRPDFSLGENTWRIIVDSDPMALDSNRDGNITASESGVLPGAILDSAPDQMLFAYRSRTTANAVVENSRGRFLRGFAPIMDHSTADPAALVAVDIEYSTVSEKFTLVRLASLAAGILLIILLNVGFLIYFASRRALVKIQLLEKEVEKQRQEIEGKDLYLG